MNTSGISIIIPTLNEADTLGPLLRHLAEIAKDAECIVVDGGSADQTPAIAAARVRTLTSPRGRGLQLNHGAAVARGDALWFLHADCWPAAECVPALLRALTDPEVVGGAFTYSFAASGWVYRLSEAISNHKNRRRRMVYGDMGVFVRREVFNALGGFREPRLMEDYEFARRLRKAGAIRILPQQITTSARDWRRTGPLRKILKDSLIKTGYNLGVPSDTLYKWYYA